MTDAASTREVRRAHAPAPRPRKTRSVGLRLVAATLVSFVTSLVFVCLSPEMRHWCVVPLFVCGTLIIPDALAWARGEVDLFDPVGLVGVMGAHFFFLAPLLHVALDYWMPYVVPPPDWRDWLGWMALLNALGLLSYRLGRALVPRRAPAPGDRVWVVAGGRFFLVLLGGLVATAALQAAIYSRFGGVSGYVEAYASRSGAFEGTGWMAMLSESFPILLAFAFAVSSRRAGATVRWRTLLAFLVVFFLCKLLFGGLRGSRSNTVWGLFWAVGIIHLRLRRIPRTLAYLGAALLVVFMYAYGLYKGAGTDALLALEGPEARADLEERSGRTLPRTLLGDLARADGQAFLLYRLSSPVSDYDLALGRTYVSTLSLLVPRALWPDPPPRKVQEGTDALYGRGTYASGRVASNVYGLAGEGMLNFGPYGVPFLYFLFGAVVGLVRRLPGAWHPADARLLLYPLAVNSTIALLAGDSDNLLFFVLKNGAVPIAAVVLGTSRVRRDAVADGRTGDAAGRDPPGAPP